MAALQAVGTGFTGAGMRAGIGRDEAIPRRPRIRASMGERGRGAVGGIGDEVKTQGNLP